MITRMGVDEVAAYSKAVTKQRIASICLALGWNSIGTLSMEVSFKLVVDYICYLIVDHTCRFFMVIGYVLLE